MNDVRGRVSLAHASHQCTSALWQPFVIIVLPSCPPASSLTATSFEVATMFCRSLNIRCSKPDRSSCVPFPRNVPFWHSRLSAAESVQVLTMKGLNLQTTFSKRWDWKKSLLSQQMIPSCFHWRVRTVTWELRVASRPFVSSSAVRQFNARWQLSENLWANYCLCFSLTR